MRPEQKHEQQFNAVLEVDRLLRVTFWQSQRTHTHKQTQAALKIGLNHQAGWSYHDIIASAIYGQR